VLSEQDSTTRQRTPGVASIPIIGNMFKRKQVSKDSTEILFFITPHIFRPDYFGRPMASVPSQGPRTQTVAQPVPLGNPQTNTPTPTQLQQDENKPPATSPTSPQVLGAPSSPAPSGSAARPGAVGGQRPQ